MLSALCSIYSPFRSSPPSSPPKSPLCIVGKGRSIGSREFLASPFVFKRKSNLRSHGDGRNSQPADDCLERSDRGISEFDGILNSDQFVSALKLGSNPSTHYSIMAERHCRNKDPVKEKALLDDMIKTDVKPNPATFTAIISSFCKNGRLGDALEVFDGMSGTGSSPTVHTYNSVLKGLCYVGRIDDAKNMMRRIPTKSRDIHTYNAVMNGLCKVGRTVEALELMDEALETGLSPNVITYNTLFNGFFKQGRPFLGSRLLKRMKETTSCKPDHISYSTVIHGLLKWGKPEAAYRIYEEMVEAGFELDSRLMNALLRGLCRRSRHDESLQDAAFHLFEKMKADNRIIDSHAYDLAVEALCRGRKMDSAYEAVIAMIGIGYSPKASSFKAAILCLCSGGEIDVALRVLVLMMTIHGRGRKAVGIPFGALVSELNSRGRCCEASVIYGMALKRGMVPKRKPQFIHKMQCFNYT